ncbi:Crp/Fnr family transcriptional regulator [Clostridiales bacterium COT073_COT-073]|nr:Crp/Fnr family transcriptional regulator [Clostridiales bacterium COT073_COT-073]
MDFNFLAKVPLFRGILPQEIEAMKDCLHLFEKKYKKNDVIYYAGDSIRTLGIILSGNVSIEHDDIWGNKSILDNIGPGQVFAETYACVPEAPLMVSVIADSDCSILFIDVAHILQMCTKSCNYHSKLIRNLLIISAQKNLNLSRRIFHTSAKSIRGRLSSYLSYQATKQGSYTFLIPFNRQQLADYLSVDRSALSNEISKMQKDGILKVSKNQFTILDVKALDS